DVMDVTKLYMQTAATSSHPTTHKSTRMKSIAPGGSRFSPPHQVYLMFKSFILQFENNTDSVYVYDGDKETGEVLGVFYGGHPPPNEGIYSSSNSLLVIFKSDKNSSYTGFQASYHAVNCS
ncbi:CUB and sushi domain-containing protein 3, partial [Desmophyllum pertusum]